MIKYVCIDFKIRPSAKVVLLEAGDGIVSGFQVLKQPLLVPIYRGCFNVSPALFLTTAR